MPTKRMREFLDRYGIQYVTVQHSPAFTAAAVAASAHLPVTGMAKTVMIEVDGRMAMAVLPASCQIDFELLRDTLGASHVALLHEREFASRFSDCPQSRDEPGSSRRIPGILFAELRHHLTLLSPRQPDVHPHQHREHQQRQQGRPLKQKAEHD